MAGSADAIAQKLSEMATVDATIIGTFVAQSGVQAVVDVGQARITVPNIGAVLPYPGQSVRLIRFDKQTFLWGPTTPESTIARVLSSTMNRAVVECPPGAAAARDLGKPSTMTLAAGDYVLVNWDDGGMIAAGPYAGAALPNAYAPPNPGAGPALPTQHRQVFTAIDSGSFGSRWFTPDVYASASNIGAWFYGPKIADTIPNDAVINSAAIYLPITKNSLAAPVLALHSSASKPAGPVAFGSTYTLPARSGWVSIPLPFLDYLKGAYGGIGMNHGGYNIWAGVQSDGLSGALDVTWTS